MDLSLFFVGKLAREEVASAILATLLKHRQDVRDVFFDELAAAEGGITAKQADLFKKLTWDVVPSVARVWAAIGRNCCGYVWTAVESKASKRGRYGRVRTAADIPTSPFKEEVMGKRMSSGSPQDRLMWGRCGRARWLGSELGSDGDPRPTVARRKCPFRAEGVGFEPTVTRRPQRFSRKRSCARRCRAARLEALADRPEIDAGSAREVHVPVRVHRRGRRGRRALVWVRHEVADRIDRDTELGGKVLVCRGRCDRASGTPTRSGEALARRPNACSHHKDYAKTAR